MTAEKETAELVMRGAVTTTKSLAEVQLALLQLLIEFERHRKLVLGKGEVSLTELQKSLRGNKGETLSYCSVPADVYRDLSTLGYLEQSGIRNYSVMQASNCDSVMILYSSKDQAHVDQALKSLDAAYSSRSLLDKDSFFLYMDKEPVRAVEGLTEEELEIFRSVAEYSDDHGRRPYAIPYTVVDLDGRRLLLAPASEHDLLDKNLRRTAVLSQSDQYADLHEKIRDQLRNRHERQDLIEKATDDQMIVDAAHPQTRVVIKDTAYDCYRNDKCTQRIPRNDQAQLHRLYDTIESMFSPVLISRTLYEKLPAKDQQDYLTQNAEAALPHDAPAVVSTKEILWPQPDQEKTDTFMKHLSEFQIPQNEKNFQSILNRISREQKRNEETQKKGRGTHSNNRELSGHEDILSP